MTRGSNFRSTPAGPGPILSFYVDRVRNGLGPFWEWLPEGSLEYDHKAYLRTARAQANGKDEPLALEQPSAGRARGR